MATFFGSEDDDFDIVDGKDERPGVVPVGKKPTAPAAQPPRPASRPVPARTPARSVSPEPVRQPQVVARPAAPSAQQPVRRAPAPTPQQPVRRTAPEPEPERYEEPVGAYEPEVDYEPEPAYEPEPYNPPASYAPRAPRQAEPAYDPTLFEPTVQRAPQPDTAPVERTAPTVVAKSKDKKPASGWGAILGIGGAKDAAAGGKQKPSGRSQWAGGRRNVLLWRILIGGLIALLVFVGLRSIFSPPAGPTYEQVQDAARAAVGDTGFPQEQGSAFALGFAKAFFTYDAKTATLRDAQLQQFVTKDVLDAIEANYTQDNQPVSQQLLDGPYLTSLVSSSKTDAVATVSFTLAGAPTSNDDPTTKVLYASFPLHYDAARNALTVSGYPTFVPPTRVADATEVNLKPDWQADDDVQAVIDQRLLPQFFAAWGASNSADLTALLAGTPRTTLRAKEGLYGSVSYVDNSVSGTIVQVAGEGQSTENRRKFQTTVTWRNAVTGATYNQTYRGWIVRQPSNAWTVEDLNNAATVSGK